MALLQPSGPGELEPILGKERGNLCHFPVLERGRKGPHRQAQKLKGKNKMKEKRVWGYAAQGSQSQAAARAASGTAPRSWGSPPRQQPGIAEEGPAGCRGQPRSGIAGWAAGGSYLVLCSSSRSQVGSVCPILYRSLESSMLWSL